jgi:glycosyltransferase involved in cell wall biosynthesis
MSHPPAPLRLHPLHRAWRALPPRGRRLLLARGSALLAPRPDQPPPPARGGLAVAGELGRPSGLGEAARLMLAALQKLGLPGWQVNIGPPLLREGHDLPPSGRSGELPPAGAPLLLHVNAPQLPLALLRLPRGLIRGRRIIGYWAWELPVVSGDWRAGLPFVHEVWVPSQFTRAALETLLPGRVHVVPPPLAAAPPAPSALDRAAFGLPSGAVVVLVSFSLASSFARKNPLGAIEAFRMAFGSRPDRILVLKIGNPGHDPEGFARLRQAADAPNIRIETRNLPSADRHALTRAADIVLSLHRSEGFGLVPAEAMLLGRAVIATGWSGNTDFMDQESAGLVGFRLVPARDPRGVFEAPGAVWADPDLGQAAELLRRLADDSVLRAELGSRGRAMVMARLGPDHLAAALGALGLTASA